MLHCFVRCAWTLRIVVGAHLPKVGQRPKPVVWNQLLTPLRAEVIDALRWYFEQAARTPRLALR